MPLREHLDIRRGLILKRGGLVGRLHGLWWFLGEALENENNLKSLRINGVLSESEITWLVSEGAQTHQIREEVG